MSLDSVRPRPARRTVYALVGLTAVAGIALVATTSTMAAASSEGVPVVNSGVTGNGAAQLASIVVPSQPAGCSAAQIRERERQLELLADEEANELRVINTITDGSAPDKLAAIRARADIILLRIEALDGRCTGGTAPAAQAPAAQAPVVEAPVVEAAVVEAPADGSRVLVALEIECAEVDFSGVGAAAAARATEELARNEAQLDGRLESDFPRFSARVARENDPDRARAEFSALAENLSDTLEARRGAILDRAATGLAAEFAATCEVVPAV